MKRWAEIIVFVALAASLHLSAFARQPQSGVTAGGSGGDAAVSINAAAPTVAEMVREWEQPSEVQSASPAEMTSPQSSSVDAPAMPMIKVDQAPRAQAAVAMVAPQAEDSVQVDTTPPPPPTPEPAKKSEPDVRPKQRPKKQPDQQGRKAEVTSAGVAKQVSAGSGGGAQAGSGAADVTTISPGQAAQLKAIWGAKILARIERNKRYPRGTKASGDVTVRLTVSRDGRLISHQITKSSGDPTLDQAALSAVSRSKRFPKAPKELQGNNFRFSVGIRMKPRR